MNKLQLVLENHRLIPLSKIKNIDIKPYIKIYGGFLDNANKILCPDNIKGYALTDYYYTTDNSFAIISINEKNIRR